MLPVHLKPNKRQTDGKVTPLKGTLTSLLQIKAIPAVKHAGQSKFRQHNDAV